jgi:cytochrome c oxidase subunit 1
LALVIVGSWLSFFFWIPPYLAWRREHPGEKTPLPVVGIFSAFIIWQMATLPVAYEDLVMLLPWSLGLTKGVNVVLARTLFWFFGHPLVYFWLLPAYVFYYTVMPALAGGKLYSDFAGRFSFLMFVLLSCPLGLHHQFADPGIAAGYKALHAALTFLVAIPSLLTAFTLAASLEHAARRNGGRGLVAYWLRLPHFDPARWLFPYLFMGLVIFVLGGITGIVNASYAMNNVVHNTAWIPAHFHLTVGGPAFLTILGGSLYLVTGLTGRKVSHPRLAALVPYLWTAGVFTFSGGLFYGGLHGEPRRTNLGLSYLNPHSSAYRPDWHVSTLVGAAGGCVMALAFAVYAYVLLSSLAGPAAAEDADAFELPASEAYHDEDVPAVRNFGPWVVAAVLLLALSYGPPLAQIAGARYPAAVGFRPNDPAPVSP